MRTTKTQHALAGRDGFTLIELMVAATLAGILMTSLLGIFNGQQQAYLGQREVADMQQNARVGLSEFARYVRSAGYLVPDGAAIDVTNSTTGPDEVTLTAAYNGGASVTIVNHDPSGQTFTVPTGDLAANTGAMVMLHDGNDWNTVQITAVTNNVTVDTYEYVQSLSPINYTEGQNADYDGGTAVPVQSRTFKIDQTDPDHPQLVVENNLLTDSTDRPIADEIEDLQIAWGIDTDSDGDVDSWSNAPADVAQIRMARVNLIARSALPVDGWPGSRPGLEARGAATSADGYRRDVLRVFEQVRNVGL